MACHRIKNPCPFHLLTLQCISKVDSWSCVTAWPSVMTPTFQQARSNKGEQSSYFKGTSLRFIHHLYLYPTVGTHVRHTQGTTWREFKRYTDEPGEFKLLLLMWPSSHLQWVQFSSVAQSCPTLCDMNRSTPGLPVHHQLSESTQTHVHCVSDAIQPSHPLSYPFPPSLNLSQHQGIFKWVSSSH